MEVFNFYVLSSARLTCSQLNQLPALGSKKTCVKKEKQGEGEIYAHLHQHCMAISIEAGDDVNTGKFLIYRLGVVS